MTPIDINLVHEIDQARYERLRPNCRRTESARSRLLGALRALVDVTRQWPTTNHRPVIGAGIARRHSY